MKVKALIFGILLIFVIGNSAFNYGFKGISYLIPTDSVRFVVPANFPKPVYDFKDNPVTGNGFKLGQILFYDPLLSKG
jgi:cytochrome c peroxidase